MEMEGRSFTSGNGAYRYGYQGEYAEKDPESGFNSFDLRQYDARLGRWMKTDPYYQYHSPYMAMGNNPVSTTDPTGGWGDDGWDWNLMYQDADFQSYLTSGGNLRDYHSNLHDAFMSSSNSAMANTAMAGYSSENEYVPGAGEFMVDQVDLVADATGNQHKIMNAISATLIKPKLSGLIDLGSGFWSSEERGISRTNEYRARQFGLGALGGLYYTGDLLYDVVTFDADLWLTNARDVLLPGIGLHEQISALPELYKTIVNANEDQYFYAGGFAFEKLLEVALVRKAAGGLKGISVRGGGMADDLVRVRHHTSPSGLKGIKNSGSINASRGQPYGVDVEVGPFIKPRNVNLGQAGRGSYIEFSVPRSALITPPGFMGGVGNAGRIVTKGLPLNLSSLTPKFVRFNWLGF